MSRRRSILALVLPLLLAAGVDPPAPPSEPSLAPVVAGHALQFPRDHGSHPDFGIEWWYLTGWLSTAGHESLGFQVTFFRARQTAADANPSAFAAHQLLIAHCDISDPTLGHLWQDQRIRRAGLGLAEARASDTEVWIDDWRLQRDASGYHTHVVAQDFSIELDLQPTQPVLAQGDAGFSRKGPASTAASYYYSEPHLRVSGHISRGARRDAVSGEAWLDHEWSSQYLDPTAVGWDWVGLNLQDGGALMAFRIRDAAGGSYWASATTRDAAGKTRSFAPAEVQFVAARRWRSPRSGVIYPLSWQLRVGERLFDLEPLLDDQENDTRASSGTLYWEGAVRAREGDQAVGRGYLELTGYDRPLTLP
ncbi:MAG TPA: lipocalin-like domain-containing protein [Steroidobacteraceae bacterium]|jgi:predicted secreted hydrolase